MSWETQGRQSHGWFGHGTAPGGPAAPSAGLGSLNQRIARVVGVLLVHFPPAERRHQALSPRGETAARVAQAMRVWVAAAGLGGDALDTALPAMTSDAVASRLRDAALLTLHAGDPATLNKAGEALASAARTMGLERWGRFAAAAAHAAAAAMAASPALRGAVIGAEEGAALGVELGVESGPGALVTGLAGGLIGAGVGYLATPVRRDLFTNPLPPGGSTGVQTPAQSVPGAVAGAPPPQVPAQTPGFPAPQGSPSNTVSTPADAPRIGTILEARPVSPEEAAKRQAVIKGKGLPTGGETPYVPPKTWTSQQPLPRGPQKGYMDANSNEWVKAKGTRIGTSHWDVQSPDGGHLNIGADGNKTHGMLRPDRLEKKQ